jgi:outer membrane immunogenic protein
VCLSGNSFLGGTGYGSSTGFGIGAFASHSRGRLRTLFTEELKMKKLVLALSAVAAFTGSAIAADMAPRPYSKAPVAVAAPVPTWTGCYVGGGGGYGMWNQENTTVDPLNTRLPRSAATTEGGRGYFGTVQGGCDYQFGAMGQQFVIGGFGDYDFTSFKGTISPPTLNIFGDEKQTAAWSVGGRAGWLVFPSLLTYFSAGYTEATFDRINFFNSFTGLAANVYLDKHTYKGYFLGAGDEYAVGFLPGLFWKTEYRLSTFDKADSLPYISTTTGTGTGTFNESKKWVQTVRSELVYRFNWGGPLVAKY